MAMNLTFTLLATALLVLSVASAATTNFAPATATPCDANSTAMDMVKGNDLHGATVVLTGGDSGIGYQTSLALASIGAKVVILSYDAAGSGAAACANITQITGNTAVSAIGIDLSSLANVRTAAAAVLADAGVKANGIDVFIADAGITDDKDGHQPNITDDGFESVVEVNYLGHFLLIELLLPTIERATWSGAKAQKPRVLSISSEASFDACTWALRPAMCLNATNLRHVVTSHIGGNCTAIGVPASNYGVTKIFQVYHMQHMATATPHGGKVDFYSLHPGFVDTPMTRSIAPATKKAWCQNSHPCPLSAEEGAATPAYLASTPSTKVDIPSGDYVYFCASHVKAAWPSVNADPVQAAANLYTQSQHWIQPHAAPLMTTPPTFPYASWSAAIKQGSCSATSTPLAINIVSKSGEHAVISCALLPFTHGDGSSDDGGALPPTIKAYAFPVGVFEVDEQLLIPPNVSFAGAANPNVVLASPDWSTQTVFLATRGVSDYDKAYCTASDMVTTRIGFVLSSFVTMRDLSYQGVDTIRPGDNGALCGGGAFELKGCAANDCSKSNVNNGGSDGLASQHVTLENLRVNDYFSKEDAPYIGIVQPGNYDGCYEKSGGCCLCKPNSVRASQIGVWVPSTRDGTASGTVGTKHLVIRNFVSTATQADGINLHGAVHDALVENSHISNTGDDAYAVWGAKLNPSNITFRNITAVNPGILRPNWYGDCVATYGLQETVFEDVVCKAPSLMKPFPQNHNATLRAIDTSLLVVHTSFGASYPQGSSITLKGGWRFENLKGEPYRAAEGVVGRNACPPVGKMAWTKGAGESDVVAPFNFPGGAPASNSVQVFTPPAKTENNRLVPNALGSPQYLSNYTAGKTVCAGRSTFCNVLLDVPSACVGGAAVCPVLFCLHGFGGNNNKFVQSCGAPAHAHDFIGVYPQGDPLAHKKNDPSTPAGWGWNDGMSVNEGTTTLRCKYNNFTCTLDPNDGVFFEKIVVALRAIGVGGNLYAFGTSNGADWVQRLGANAGPSLPFKGIAPQSGQLNRAPPRSAAGPFNVNQPQRGGPRVAQLSIHGSADPVIPYAGGPKFESQVFIMYPEGESDGVWATHNGCASPLKFTTSNVSATYHKQQTGTAGVATHHVVEGCPASAPVEWYETWGAGHVGTVTLNGVAVMETVCAFFMRVEKALREEE